MKRVLEVRRVMRRDIIGHITMCMLPLFLNGTYEIQDATELRRGRFGEKGRRGKKERRLA